MPAALPGASTAQNAANPSQGACVFFDLLSGPKGSPKDNDQTGNNSTGGISTGLGFGSPPILSPTVQAIKDAGFTDDYTVGVTKPDGTAASDATLCYIGGGRTNMVGTPAVPTTVPYTAGFGFGMAGNGGSRDAGAGPAFTGFITKLVTSAAGTAVGVAVETGWLNRSGVALTTGQHTFGSSNAASAAVA